MRLLHTSDWHLGRSFHEFGLLDAQEAFLGWLLDVAREQQVDAVLVAGDVYDRAVPPVDAVALYDEFVVRCVEARIPLVLISGNHDSAERLGVGARVLDRSGVHLRTKVSRLGEPVLLSDGTGEVAIYPIPYLEPDAVRGDLGIEGRGHDAVLREAMRRVAADLADRPGTRSVVLAHAFVTGATTSDSERDITVGGAASVGLDVFADIDVVALGHLHGCQRLSGSTAYSGSPIAYSFSEARQPKSVTVVDLDATGTVTRRHVPVPVHRRLATVSGTLEELLRDPAMSELEQCYLSVTLTDKGSPQDPMRRLRTRFPHVATLAWEPVGGRAEVGSFRSFVRGRSDREICAEFVRHTRNDGPTAEESTLLDSALAAAAGRPVADDDRTTVTIPAARPSMDELAPEETR